MVLGVCNELVEFESKEYFALQISDKRKSSTNLSATQPPLKKMATDVTANSMASASMGGNMQGAMDGFSNQLANPGMMQASSSGQMVESIPSAAIRRDQGSDLAQRVSAVLRQAWKDDQDTGHLLGSLYEVFGEAIFSFVQPPEISLFV
jgi:transcription initiation factor TFIID subunit 6